MRDQCLLEKEMRSPCGLLHSSAQRVVEGQQESRPSHRWDTQWPDKSRCHDSGDVTSCTEESLQQTPSCRCRQQCATTEHQSRNDDPSNEQWNDATLLFRWRRGIRAQNPNQQVHQSLPVAVDRMVCQWRDQQCRRHVPQPVFDTHQDGRTDTEVARSPRDLY